MTENERLRIEESIEAKVNTKKLYAIIWVVLVGIVLIRVYPFVRNFFSSIPFE